jgi:hypothetical protein
VDWINLAHGRHQCHRGNEPSDYIKGWKFLYYFSVYKRFKNGSSLLR